MSMCWFWAAARQAAWGRRYTRLRGAQLAMIVEFVPMRYKWEACLADADLVITGEAASTVRPFTVSPYWRGKHRQTV